MPYNKPSGFKGGREGSGQRKEFKRPSFGGSNFSKGRDTRGPLEMHQTTCADCQKMCEVPFRPNGKKPVYCKDCFGKNGGQTPATTKNYPQSNFDNRIRNENSSVSNDRLFTDLIKQIEMTNAKLDTLIALGTPKTPVKKAAPKKK
jgi:CxxC-x17-CxxC domain-containing protein